MKLKLSQKQKLTLFQILNNPQIVDILYGGGAGGAKSMTIGIWMLLECRNYPGIRIGLGRKELTRLKQTTVHTILREVHPLLDVSEDEYHYSEQKGLITYINGSEIQLIDLARMPSDPDYDRFGSLNFTHTVIEEGGEVDKKSKNVFNSRKNRYLNKKYNIVGKSIITCNPSQNFLKQDYYNKYKELGAGVYQKWEHGKVEIDGELKTAYRCFIRSLATDNPFLPRNYIEVLRQLPPAERKRLLEGNWDYGDDDLMLFPSRIIDRAIKDRIVGGEMFIGVDISDAGSDETVLSLVEGNQLTEQIEIKVNIEEAIGEQIALEIIKYAQQHGLNSSKAKNIGIDVIGVGASTRDFLRSKGWYVREFVAGSGTPTTMFKNLRGQTIYRLSQAMEQEDFTIYSQLKTMDKLRDQLMAHEYTTEERVIIIKSKKEIKDVLGRSPDHAESAYIAFWVARGDNDPKRNSNRIVF